MTAKEFANELGLSVNELAEITGYTRQGLNDIIVGGATKESQKRIQTFNNLCEYNKKNHENILKQEDEANNKRFELIHMI